MTKSRLQPNFPDILNYSRFLTLITLLFLAQCTQCVYGSCTGGLHEVDGKCCYPCHPGYRRVWPCNIIKGTFCILCDPGTYTTHNHVLKKCLLCKVCDSERGLVIRRKCSNTSNTVCGCSPGYFCTEMKDDDCKQCVPHRVCSPGQYVKSKGTERNNTICEKCQAGTFSTNGTLDRCLPWTNCTAQGLYEERPGTAITDARCSQDSHFLRNTFIIIFRIGMGIGIGIILFIIISILRCRKNNAQEEGESNLHLNLNAEDTTNSFLEGQGIRRDLFC